MNRVITAPFKAAASVMGSALHGVSSVFTYVGRRVGAEMSLVPLFLQNLLWLISTKFLQLAQQGYGQNSAVYACLTFLSHSIPEPPLLPYTVTPDGKQTPLPTTHPLAQLIKTPNPFMTEYEFVELTTLHLGIVGRSTWWKERNNDGSIRALWPLRPDRVGPIYDKAAVLAGWSYQVPGTGIYTPIPAGDVVLFNFPDPAGDSGGMVEGLGPLQVLASEVGADNEATRFVGALLANSAMPGAVLTTKTSITSQAQADLIKAAFNREFAGVRRGSVGVVDADTTFTQTGFNLQQLEFPALRRISESRIAAAFGTPAVLVGLLVGLEHGQAFASLNAMRQIYAETTCENYWRRLEDVYTRDVAKEFDPTALAQFDRRRVKALAEQIAGETNKITEGFKAGAVSYDEYRDKVLGLPALPTGGGRRVLPRGAIEIDENGNIIQAPPAAPAPLHPAIAAMIDQHQEPGNAETPPEPATVARNGHGTPAAKAAGTHIIVSAQPAERALLHTKRVYDAWKAENQDSLWPDGS